VRRAAQRIFQAEKAGKEAKAIKVCKSFDIQQIMLFNIKATLIYINAV
jgi:hypothetical protein